MSNSRHGPPRRSKTPSRRTGSRGGSRSGSRSGGGRPPRSRGRGAAQSSFPWQPAAVIAIIVLILAAILWRFWTSSEEPASVDNQVPPTASAVATTTVSAVATITATTTSPSPVVVATNTATTVSASPTVTDTGESEPDPVGSTTPPPDIPALQQHMLTLINEDRRANGLSELLWDDVSTTTSLRHAEEMARFGYLSHWNLDGHGPDVRYSLVGGVHYLRENVYQYQHSPNAGPTSAEEWHQLIRDAQKSFMDSPGHRANILTPEHTHVGIGIAYDDDPESGWLAIAQGFVGQYITLSPLPHLLSLGNSVTLSGRLAPDATNPLLNLAYEPLPTPKSISELNTTATYESPSEVYENFPIQVDGEGNFTQEITLNHQEQPGLYHVRVWVDTQFGKILASNVIIEVQ